MRVWVVFSEKSVRCVDDVEDPPPEALRFPPQGHPIVCRGRKVVGPAIGERWVYVTERMDPEVGLAIASRHETWRAAGRGG